MGINQLIPIQEYRRGHFMISTDPDRLDVDVVHDYLANQSYWAAGIARETVALSMTHSLCYGVYLCQENTCRQIGLARVITDFATFAYLSDVFILEPYRGQGLGKWLVECVLANPHLQTVRKFTLDTKDAHGLYAQFQFKPNPTPENHMVFRPAPAAHD